MQHPLLTTTAESRSTAADESWAAGNGVQGRRVLACDSPSAIVGLTLADVGIGFRPRLFRRKRVAGGPLHAYMVVAALPGIEYCCKWHTGDTRAFIPALGQFAKDEADYTRSLGFAA